MADLQRSRRRCWKKKCRQNGSDIQMLLPQIHLSLSLSLSLSHIHSHQVPHTHSHLLSNSLSMSKREREREREREGQTLQDFQKGRIMRDIHGAIIQQAISSLSLSLLLVLVMHTNVCDNGIWLIEAETNMKVKHKCPFLSPLQSCCCCWGKFNLFKFLYLQKPSILANTVTKTCSDSICEMIDIVFI